MKRSGLLAKFFLFFVAVLLLQPSLLVSALASPSMPSTTTSTRNTLGAATLQQLVSQAAQEDANKSLDVSGVLWLEHINLVVGSKPLAQQFYLDLLGMSADKSKSFHCNLGQQQFHLAPGESPQIVTGSIGLVVPSIAAVQQRLVEQQQAGNADNAEDQSTQWEIVETTPTTLTLTCPWGNRLHLYNAKLEPGLPHPHPQKMVQMHGPGGEYAHDRMAIRGQPGIRYIEVACRPGTTPAIAHFYQEMLSCTVSSLNHHPKAAIAVCVGPGVHLVFVEQDTVSETDFQAMEGVHICIYVNDFQRLYQRLQQRNLIWTNPRFTHLDSCDTWEEAMVSRTLRFKDIVDLTTGEKLLELEHETRPLRHGQYLKVPFYEPK